MKNILYGYQIIDGKAVAIEEEAERIRQTAKFYLEGASFVQAAKQAGLVRNHGTVRHMLETTAYLGTDFYPPILDEKTFYAIQIERNRRCSWLDRDTRTRKIPTPLAVHKKFKMPETIDIRYSDPFKQAEYIYSLIESEGE